MSAKQTGMDINKIKGKTAAPERTCASHMEDSELNASDGLFAMLQLFLTFFGLPVNEVRLKFKGNNNLHSQNVKERKACYTP